MTNGKNEDTPRPGPHLATVLAEIYDEERRVTEPPSLEEMLAHLEGELDAAQEEAFQERLALHPEASRRLLELQDPPPIAADADLPLPDPEPLRQRLAEAGLFDPPDRVVSFPEPARGAHPAYRWAAAALLLLSLGLTVALLRQGSAPAAPTVLADIALLELLPRSDSGQRGVGEELQAGPGFVYDLLLWADEVVPTKAYRLTVVDAAGREVMRRELRTRQPGRVILRLAVGDLETGRYELRLSKAGEDDPIAVYDLEWREP